MASPGVQSICCVYSKHAAKESNFTTSEWNLIDWDTVIYTYNIMCILSGTLGIGGAIYQLSPRQPKNIPRTKREMESYIRQNIIICWLAAADLNASLGVVVRSIVWLIGFYPWEPYQTATNADFEHVFCAISSAWIQYCYLCTYFWTFFYALDIFLLVHNKPCQLYLYHSAAWILSAGLTLAGVLPIYLPSITNCSHARYHYMSTYIPIMLVMICNPILYYYSSIRVKKSIRGRGMYTDHERQMISNIKTKFFCVTMVFYLCWSCNIAHGTVLIFTEDISTDFFLAIWHFMAIVNPIQSFLNAIVYRGLGGCRMNWKLDLGIENETVITRPPRYRPSSYSSRNSDIQDYPFTTDAESSVSEKSPLLSFRTS